MRYVTFGFDDGYLASTKRTARIYESLGLRAEFNVTVALAARSDAEAPRGAPPGEEYAGFDLLNELQRRGHVIQPHVYSHTDECGNT